MAIILRCEACHKEGHLPEEMAGKRVKCRACGRVQLCPSGSTKAVVEAKKAPAPAKGIDFPHFEPPALTSRTTKGDRRSARARAEDDKEVGKPANSRLVLVVASSVLVTVALLLVWLTWPSSSQTASDPPAQKVVSQAAALNPSARMPAAADKETRPDKPIPEDGARKGPTPNKPSPAPPDKVTRRAKPEPGAPPPPADGEEAAQAAPNLATARTAPPVGPDSPPSREDLTARPEAMEPSQIEIYHYKDTWRSAYTGVVS